MKTRDFFKYAATPFNLVILLCILIFILVGLETISANIFVVLTSQNKPVNQKFVETYFTVASPPVFYGVNKIIENHTVDIIRMFPEDKEGMMRGYIELITNSYPRNLSACIFLSVVMAMIALWHGWSRKNNRLSLALWIIFVGLFNIAGLLTYLALNHTTLLKCSACGKQRNLDMSNCIHCGAGLLLPPASIVKIK
jgi:hypothetical protein